MHLAAVPHEVDHQIECERISVYEYFVIFLLQGVAAREQGFQGTALNMTQSRLSDAKVILASHVELYNLVQRLYLFYSVQFILPSTLLLFELLLLILNNLHLHFDLIH